VNTSGNGSLDPGLLPQEALSIEGGLRAGADRWDVDLSAFRIALRNELVPFERKKTGTSYANFGASRRHGVEAFVRIEPTDGLELRGSYAWLRAVNRTEGAEGRAMPGHPEHRGFARVRMMWRGLHAAAETELTSGYFADDANQLRTPSSVLVGLRAGGTLRWGPHAELDLTLGVRNVLDAHYVDNARLNAFGDRSFEAGAPRHLYGQLTVARR
jgi:outer membrane receptor protein involved in Fe transport